MRARVKHYTDICLTDLDVKKIKKGYSVTKCIVKEGKDYWFSIKNSSDRKTQRKIERLKAEIKQLKSTKRR